MKKYFSLALLFISSAYLFAQAPRLNNDCQFANEIVIEESGIHPVSKNISDTITTDVKSNTVLYSYADQSKSFWYKIYANDNCEIAFEIYPDKAGNTFNYFLYKIPADVNVNEIETKNIVPVRANLYKDDMFSTGTGLSLFSAVNFNDPNSEDRTKDFYYTPYHSAMPAKTGEVFMLNIYHVEGTDCGYRFTLRNEKHYQKFQAIFHSSYAKQLSKIKVKRYLNLDVQKNQHVVTKVKMDITKAVFSENVPLPVRCKTDSVPLVGADNSLAVQNKKEEIVITCIVKDSLKHSTLVVDVICTKKGSRSNSRTDEQGKYQAVLDKNTQYTLVFSALGYKNKIVSFSTKENISSFTQDVLLSPVGEGDNFVMDKIYFYPNTYEMKPGALPELDKLVAYLTVNPDIKVEIQGHTSGNKRIKADRGDKDEEESFTGSSKKLSQFRAETIKKYLTQKGILAERLTAIGYGGSEMIYRHPKNQAEANKNIRVAILILPQKENVLSSKLSR